MKRFICFADKTEAKAGYEFPYDCGGCMMSCFFVFSIPQQTVRAKFLSKNFARTVFLCCFFQGFDGWQPSFLRDPWHTELAFATKLLLIGYFRRKLMEKMV